MSAAMPILKSMRLGSVRPEVVEHEKGDQHVERLTNSTDRQHRENAVKSSSESTDFIVDSCSQGTFLGKTQISVPTQLAEDGDD